MPHILLGFESSQR